MGILRREEEIAARNDRCYSPPSPSSTRACFENPGLVRWRPEQAAQHSCCANGTACEAGIGRHSTGEQAPRDSGLWWWCRTLDEAFQDLRGLMAKAREMVQLAEKFRGTLAGKGGAEAPEGETLDADMQRQLLEIGIASPVTRELAGALYHQQLSRQVRPKCLPQQA